MVEDSRGRTKDKSIWESWPTPEPKLLRLLKASDEEIERADKEQRKYEERVLREEGPEGKARIIDEGLDMLVERLNAFQRYFEEVESWKERARSDYVIVRKKDSQQDSR